MLGGEKIIFGIWFLIGVVFIFWMQAGFAMVEAGFTRAKNTGNIIMKNLMDFCIGTVVFILIGFGLLLGEDCIGLIGKPGFDIFTNYSNFDFSNFVFNLVFCATTATIVSGAMAERTKFLSYCIYSSVISAFIYPIEAHWIWGGGFLQKMGFHDFAGSCAIHMVGGISAIIGAKILGARIGKFKKLSDGTIKVGAFPGHNLTIGALGVFILWFGWYGFNGAACTDIKQLGSVFLTTTIAPSMATLTCMIFTWIKYKRPDVSMCLNASLAGLVAITAGCDIVDAFGALCIGGIAGLLVVFGVWFLDYKLRIDDPVGAVAVHMLNGIFGTIAVGLFATGKTPLYNITNGMGQKIYGLFYGGGFKLLFLQLIGIICVAIWTSILITIVFIFIKKTIGLRVSKEEEMLGLDSTEHGLSSAYAGFLTYGDSMSEKILTDTIINNKKYKKDEIVPNENICSDISKLSIICKQNKFEELKLALNTIGIYGITVSQVLGCGVQKGQTKYYRGVEIDMILLPKVKVEIVIEKKYLDKILSIVRNVLYTGNIGDGKIFIYNLTDVIKVRTGERGIEAIKG